MQGGIHIAKDVMRIDLTVKDYIPYLLLGDPMCDPYHDGNHGPISSPRAGTLDVNSGDEIEMGHESTSKK